MSTFERTVTGFASGQCLSPSWMTWKAAQLDCGHTFSKEALETIKVGDVKRCDACETLAREEQWLRDLDYSQVHHSRYRENFGGRYLFYRLDKTSPSNFMLIGAVQATTAIDEILKTKTNCGPLSPTERA